jgi:outer membrane protein W
MMRILFFFVLMLITKVGVAQLTSTAQTLRLARSTYEQGRLHELPELLKPVLAAGDKAQKVEAYELLTEAYIYLEEPEKADDAMLNLLRTDPYYRPNPDVAPAELNALYKTFRTREIYRLGVKGGANILTPNFVSSNNASVSSLSSKSGFGFTGSATVEIPITDKFTLNPELQFQLMNFSGTSTSQQSTGEFSTLAAYKFGYVSAPITIQYQVFDSKLKPYALVGISPDYLISSSITFNESRAGFTAVGPSTFNSIDAINKFNLSSIAGAGIRLRIAGGYLVAEFRFKYGFSSITSIPNTYSNPSQVFDFKYADGIYKLTSYSLSVGYVQNFFNPKKKKLK